MKIIFFFAIKLVTVLPSKFVKMEIIITTLYVAL